MVDFEDLLTPESLRTYLFDRGYSAGKLQGALGVSPSTLFRWLKGSDTTRPTGTAAAVLAFMMALSGKPVVPEHALPGYRLYKMLQTAVDEAGPQNRLLTVLRMMEESENVSLVEDDAMSIYRLHQKHLETRGKPASRSPKDSPFLIPLLEAMGLDDQAKLAGQGKSVSVELNPTSIKEHFASLGKDLQIRIQKLSDELYDSRKAK
ncbi:MAG: hypothetical protein ACLQPD_14780 [Desulfomonilaceae bacterium]